MNVVPLPARRNKSAPDPRVVAELEEWLEKAKTGEIIGVGIVGLFDDDRTFHVSVGNLSRAVVGRAFALATSLTAVLDRDGYP